MGTDIVVMYEGKVMQHATPEEVYHNPANLFVAQFIGDPGMNALKVESGGYVGFKPRSACLARKEGGLNLSGEVLTCEFMGYEQMLTINIGIGNVVVRAKERREAGELVWIHVPQEELYYFDCEQNRTDKVQDGKAVEVYHAE